MNAHDIHSIENEDELFNFLRHSESRNVTNKWAMALNGSKTYGVSPVNDNIKITGYRVSSLKICK